MEELKMKSKLIPVCIVVALSLCLSACMPTSKQVSVAVSCDDFMGQNHISQEAQVAVGGSLTVTLCSNRTTGFEWVESAEISDQTVLQQTDHRFVPPEETGVVGAAGTQVWTFQALKKGTSTISMEYSRPWEGGEKGEWTFNLTVTVK
jgi:inhibitor of cysteine peptidase